MTEWEPSEELVVQALSYLQAYKPAISYEETSEWLAAAPEIDHRVGSGGAPEFTRASINQDRLLEVVRSILSADPNWTPSEALSASDAVLREFITPPHASGLYSQTPPFGPHQSGHPFFGQGDDWLEEVTYLEISTELFTALQSALAQLPILLRDIEDVLDSRSQEARAARIVQFGSSLALCLAANHRDLDQPSPGKVTVDIDVLVNAIALFLPHGLAISVFSINTAAREEESEEYDVLPTYALMDSAAGEVLELAKQEGLLTGDIVGFDAMGVRFGAELFPSDQDGLTPPEFTIDHNLPLPGITETDEMQILLLKRSFDAF